MGCVAQGNLPHPPGIHLRPSIVLGRVLQITLLCLSYYFKNRHLCVWILKSNRDLESFFCLLRICYTRLLRSFYLRQKVRTDLRMEEPGPPTGVPKGARRREQSGRRLLP